MSSNVHQSNTSRARVNYIGLSASRETEREGDWANYISVNVHRNGHYCRIYNAVSNASVVRVQRAQRVMSERSNA